MEVMAKRFIDTEIFKDPKIRGLRGATKLLYIYMFCDCDHAGIWDVELDVAELRLGFSFDTEQVLEELSDHVEPISDSKWYLKGFVRFQYGELNPENRAHKSVIDILNKHKIKPLTSPSLGCKDKDKDKVKVKVKVKVNPPTLKEWGEYAESIGWSKEGSQSAFDHYEANGWVQGKNKPIKDWKAACRNCFRRDGGKVVHTAKMPAKKRAVLEKIIYDSFPNHVPHLGDYIQGRMTIPPQIKSLMDEELNDA
jgi:hypothetical protein